MVDKKSVKDILKGAKAISTGASADDIEFSKLKKRNVKKKTAIKNNKNDNDKDVLGNNEGFGVVGSAVDFCSYAEIGKPRKQIKTRPLEEWGAFDFFCYFENKFIERYSRPMGLNKGGNSVEINRIRDKFYNLFGFCCNLIMKDYMDFFFNNYLHHYVSKKGGFYFRQMRNDKLICEFYEGYDFKKSLNSFTPKNVKQEDELSFELISSSYSIGVTSLVSKYGIVIAFNWIVKFKGRSLEDAARIVLNACRELYKKNMGDIIRHSTEKYSPYSSELPFKGPQRIMDRIDKNMILDVKFVKGGNRKFMEQ